MCGRYSLAVELPMILEEFSVDENAMEFRMRFNIAPTQRIAGVVEREGKRRLEAFHWGLIPAWAKDKKIAYSTINARAETVQTKPTFRSVFTRNRMIVCASSFFEWKTEGKEKQPFAIGLRDKKVFGFAGLYDTWTDSEGKEIQSCTIITTTPNVMMAPIHDRMPVILDEKGIRTWLDPEIKDKAQLQELLVPLPAELMHSYRVQKLVGNVRNETPAVLEPVEIS